MFFTLFYVESSKSQKCHLEKKFRNQGGWKMVLCSGSVNEIWQTALVVIYLYKQTNDYLIVTNTSYRLNEIN